MLSAEQCLEVLKSIDLGIRTVVPHACPHVVYAGNIEYVTDDGWKITVFNDCNEWDYVDSVQSPLGDTFECFPDDPNETEVEERCQPVRNWKPSAGDWWITASPCDCPWCKPTPQQKMFVDEAKRLKAMMDSQRDAVITALGSHAMDSWRTSHAPLDTLVRQVVFNLESMAQVVIQAKRQN